MAEESKWKKDVSTFITLIKQKFNISSKEKTVEDSADIQNYDDVEDEPPLDKTRMTDGEREKTLSINKNLVNLAIFVVIFVVAAAFYYKSYEDTDMNEAKNPSQQVHQQPEQASDPNLTQQKNSSGLDYKDPQIARLAQIESENGGKKTGQQLTRNNNNNSTVQNRQQAVPTIPQNTQVYNTPYTLPSTPAIPAQPVASSNSSNADREEQKEKRSIEERFKSAIAFALTGRTDSADNSSGQSASMQGSASGTNGSAGIQPATSSFAYSAPSDSVLQAGAIIPVMLYSGINTDSAGQVTAMVQADVYDTATNSRLLIPAGSQIVGKYEAGASESGRVNVAFSRIVLPDGGAYSIGDSMVAVDGQGYYGIQGNLHRHTATKIRNGIMNSLFTALSTISVDRVTLGADTFNHLTSDSVKPTVTVEPGCEFNIYVTQPIAFSD